MKEVEIEKLRQIVSRSDKTGNEKVEMLVQFVESQLKNCNLQNVNNSALPKLTDFAINNFDHISEITKRITTGNVAHHRNTIEGLAKRCSEFIREHYC